MRISRGFSRQKGLYVMTNYEKIKSMSIEELSYLLESFSACSRCRRWGNDCFPVMDVLQWLESEAKE
jgi:hypothetical protein